MARNASGRYPGTIRVPFTGAGTIIPDGAPVVPGTSQGTTLGLAVQAAANADWTDCVGLTKGASVVANDSTQTGTVWTYAEIELIDSIDLIEMDWSLATADLVTCTQAVSTTTLTLTSLESNADCGWFYVAAGTGIGQLLFATAINGGTATLMTAPSPALDTTSKLVHIKRFGHKLHFTALSTGATGTGYKLASQAAVGSVKFMTLENYIESQSNGIGKQLLNPTLHNGITLKGVGTAAPKVTFSTKGVMRNTGGRN